MLLSEKPALRLNTMQDDVRVPENSFRRLHQPSSCHEDGPLCSTSKRQRVMLESVKAVAAQTAVTCYSGITRKGYAPAHPYKKNQDALVIIDHCASNSIIFACLDGHGEYGDVIAQHFKENIETRLCAHATFLTDLRTAIKEVIADTEKELLDNKDLDTRMSGTTLCLAIVRGHRLLVANVGDSRAILGTRNESNEIKTERLTIDHKPDVPSEMIRILASGGRVSAIKYEDGKIGPARVWLGRSTIPGLAMARSLCDTVAHMAGVTSNIDFFERDLDPASDLMLVVATDGLWEFTKDDETVDIISKCSSPSEAILKLINVSNEKWLSSEHVIDDTTICVAFLNRK